MLWHFSSILGQNKRIIFTESLLFKAQLTEMRSGWVYLCSKVYPQKKQEICDESMVGFLRYL